MEIKDHQNPSQKPLRNGRFILQDFSMCPTVPTKTKIRAPVRRRWTKESSCDKKNNVSTNNKETSRELLRLKILGKAKLTNTPIKMPAFILASPTCLSIHFYSILLTIFWQVNQRNTWSWILIVHDVGNLKQLNVVVVRHLENQWRSSLLVRGRLK